MLIVSMPAAAAGASCVLLVFPQGSPPGYPAGCPSASVSFCFLFLLFPRSRRPDICFLAAPAFARADPRFREDRPDIVLELSAFSGASNSCSAKRRPGVFIYPRLSRRIWVSTDSISGVLIHSSVMPGISMICSIASFLSRALSPGASSAFIASASALNRSIS